MKNFVQEGKKIEVTGPSGGVTSGQAFMIGILCLVACVDIAEGATGNAATEGVFDLSVKGEDGSGNKAVAYGDRVYLDAGVLNADNTNGVAYGIALGAVTSGSTTTIPVFVANK